MTTQTKLAQARQAYLTSAANELALRRKLEGAQKETDSLAEIVRVLEQLEKEAQAQAVAQQDIKTQEISQ